MLTSLACLGEQVTLCLVPTVIDLSAEMGELVNQGSRRAVRREGGSSDGLHVAGCSCQLTFDGKKETSLKLVFAISLSGGLCVASTKPSSS